MFCEDLRSKWISQSRNNGEIQKLVWDSAAHDFHARDIPSFDTDEFLKLVNDTAAPDNTMTSLDVGCGAGRYSFAMAQRVKKAVGVDISPNMIDFAKSTESTMGIKNTEFICLDWSKADIDKLGFREAFDIVFAHMTPAICDFDTFDKMNACSKKFCYMQKPTRRYDNIQEKILELLNIKEPESKDRDVVYAFDYLWRKGYCPEISYRDELWSISKTLDEAFVWYINRTRLIKELDSAEELKIGEFLTQIASDGILTGNVNTTIITMFWRV